MRIGRPTLPPGALSAVLLGVAVFLSVVAAVGVTVLAEPGDSGLVHVRLLGVNDFHGHLEPTDGRGGAAYLGTHLDRAAASGPRSTIRVHAGDMVGASPLLSSHFHDEPTVKAMNLMRFDVGTVGNHEFDEGGPEMLRLIRGGHRADGLQFKRDENGNEVDTSDPAYPGANFPYIAANTVDTHTGGLVLPPYRVIERQGVKIGFIGVTTPATPTWLLRRFSKDYRYLDISDTVNRYVARLQRRGVQAIVVLAHSGAFESGGTAGQARGEIVDETRQMNDAVDVVIAGHTHSHLNLTVDGKLVVESWSYGRGFDEVNMSIDPGSGDVVKKSAETPQVTDDVPPDRRIESLVSGYERRVAPLGHLVFGTARRELDNEPDELGRLVADGQRRYAHADVGIVNDASIRNALPAGPITYAELHDVHAYEHRLVRMRLSGRDLAAVPESAYTNGMPVRIDPDHTYVVVANEMIADSDRWFPSLRNGTDRETLGTDLESLIDEVRRLHTVG